MGRADGVTESSEPQRTPPRVSVIVATFNSAGFLDEALRSVFAQSFRDFEVIVVDDGSKDGSRALTARWREREPARLRAITHQGRVNRGIATTYTLGVEHARGEYLAFNEPDDRWSPTYLAEKVALLDKDPRVGVVFSPYRVMHRGLYGYDMVVRQAILRRDFPVDRPFDNFVPLLRFNNVVTFSAFVLRRSLWAHVPAPDDPRTPFFDWWVLVHSSLRSQFYYDRHSEVRWRCAADTTLGKRPFRLYTEELSAYFAQMFASLERLPDFLDAPRRRALERAARALPHYLAFLERPRADAFFRFLRCEPDWALRALASYVVNWLKKA